MIERKQSEDTAPRIIVAWFLCSFGSGTGPSMSVIGESLGEIGTVWKQTAATDLGDD